MANRNLTDKEKLSEVRKSLREYKARNEALEKENKHLRDMMDHVCVNRRSYPDPRVFEQETKPKE